MHGVPSGNTSGGSTGLHVSFKFIRQQRLHDCNTKNKNNILIILFN